MSLAKITLWAMNEWMLASDDDLFHNLVLPEGMDKDKLVNIILLNGAEFEVLYGDPNFMKYLIGLWSHKHFDTFTRWVRALSIDYNPLENYDRMEEWSDAGHRDRTGSIHRSEANLTKNTNTEDVNVEGNKTNVSQGKSSHSSDTSGTSVNATSSFTEGDKTNEHTVSAYDSSSYQADNKDEEDMSQKTNGNSVTTDQTSGSDNITNHENAAESMSTKTGTTGSNNTSNVMQHESTEDEGIRHTDVHSGRMHGNIGVTTSQEMLKQEWEVAKLNIYDEAATMFLADFCVYTY